MDVVEVNLCRRERSGRFCSNVYGGKSINIHVEWFVRLVFGCVGVLKMLIDSRRK
jgi:hypothetical protein